NLKSISDIATPGVQLRNYPITKLQILLLCPLPIFVQNLVHLLRCQVLVKVVIDLDRWRPAACANTFNFFKRKHSVWSCAFMSDAEFLLTMLQQFFSTAEQACDICANLHVEFATPLGRTHRAIAD